MALNQIEQNVKALMESVYEYDRLLNSKASKKELTKVASYAIRLIDSIRQGVEKERGHE